MSVNGNTDIYRVSAGGGTPVRLTNAPGIDVGGSYSPDGSKIVFESDRSGGQQLYVMNADGSNQSRISFGGGSYATPEWSPRGDLIAFTRLAGNFRIGVMKPGGGGDRQLAGRGADLVAQRPRHPVLPHQPGPRRHVERLAGRPDRRQRTPHSHPARRIGPRLGPFASLTTLQGDGYDQERYDGGGLGRCAGDRRLRQEGTQGNPARADRGGSRG
jgi:dipeptidyl aminopeptidase/acylaminoacyl peptidase